MFTEYEPGARIAHISPTLLLLVVALQDHLTVADEARGLRRALHPKQIVTLKGGHFDAYVADFDAASGAVAAWFKQRLSRAKRRPRFRATSAACRTPSMTA